MLRILLKFAHAASFRVRQGINIKYVMILISPSLKLSDNSPQGSIPLAIYAAFATIFHRIHYQDVVISLFIFIARRRPHVEKEKS